MIFSPRKGFDVQRSETAGSLLRILQQLLEACGLHSVEFDRDEHAAFRSSLRSLSDRFEHVSDHKDLLILGGEANKTIQSHNQAVEKFIRELSLEKQSTIELLVRTVLRMSSANEKAAETLRRIGEEMAKPSQLQEMRTLKAQLEDCLGLLCMETEVQQAQFRELKERLTDLNSQSEPRDNVTGLSTSASAISRIRELALSGNQGFVIVFWLKNLEAVNRRFGFSGGDDVLRRFAAYLGNTLQGTDQLFRWRGPCFVIVAQRFESLETVLAEAQRIGVRGPETEIEKDGRCMLIRLNAAVTAFSLAKLKDLSTLQLNIDQFTAEQFALSQKGRT